MRTSREKQTIIYSTQLLDALAAMYPTDTTQWSWSFERVERKLLDYAVSRGLVVDNDYTITKLVRVCEDKLLMSLMEPESKDYKVVIATDGYVAWKCFIGRVFEVNAICLNANYCGPENIATTFTRSNGRPGHITVTQCTQ